MEEIVDENHIILANAMQKSIIFKAMDSICLNEGVTQSIASKNASKPLSYDSLDYLKSNFKITTEMLPTINLDNGTKSSKKHLKRKLYPVKIKLSGSRNDYIRCFTPLVDFNLCKTPSQDLLKWFSENLRVTNSVSPQNIDHQVFVAESVAVFITPVCYKSRAAISFDRNRIVFQLYLKEWFQMELSSAHVNSLTVYSKYPYIKLSLKSKLVDDMSRLYTKYGLHHSDMYKSNPKKVSGLKDLMLIFTDKQLTHAEYVQLVAILGDDKLRWNDSERDSKEILENALYKNPHLSELIASNDSRNWSLIFEPKPKETVPTVEIGTHSNSSKQSIGNSAINPQKPFVTSTPNKTDPVLNLSQQQQQQQPPPTTATVTSPITNGTQSNINITVNMESPKHLQSTNLMYVPNRNLSNVFDTFHYNPASDSDVLIRGTDLLCLNFGQYLNDNIINFYLNFIRYEVMNDDQRQRTHLFNVFFNTKLQGAQTAAMATGTAEERHARVAKWTKRVDIFEKDYIIVPINENQHWFLAIICFPWMAGMVSYDQLLGVGASQPPLEIPGNDSVFATRHRPERVKRLREKYGMSPSPCILLFDSLQYQSRAPNVKLIREYLKTEWDKKRSATDGPLVFDKNTVRGFNPQVPRQTNHIDCGIFVLHYVEQFFNHPVKVFTKEYFQSSLLRWFENETVARKRASIQKMVLAKADAFFGSNASRNSSDVSTSTAASLDDSCPDIQIL